jgi:hypothetical protein
VGYFEETLKLSSGRSVASDDERRDATRQLVSLIQTGLGRSDYATSDESRSFLDFWSSRPTVHEGGFTKAVTLHSVAAPLADTHRGGHQSVLYVNQLGVLGLGQTERYAEKPMGGGFEFLRYMMDHLDVGNMIRLCRQRQVGSFIRPYREDDNNPLGYRWVRRDGERLTPADEKTVRRLDDVLQSCGTELDPVRRGWLMRRRALSGFVNTLIADTLTADACPIEVVTGTNGRPAGWYNIPFDTVRLAHEDGYEGDDRIVAVQLQPNERIPFLGFEASEMVYEVRNPRSLLEYHDYGQSELEHCIRAATAYLNTCTFNSAAVDRNSIPRGFLTLYGKFDLQQQQAFKQQWNELMRGATKRWHMPVMVAESKQEGGAAWTAVDSVNQEMFMIKWVILQIALLCSAFGIDPTELNMESFSSKVSSLSGSDTSEKLQSSRDRGLIPLMIWLENLLNEQIIRRLNPKYRITWVGLFPDDEVRKHERQKLVCTVNELRAIDGEEEHKDPTIGDAPVNVSLMGLYQQRLAMQQQDAAGFGGDGSEDGGAYGLPDSERPYGLPSPQADAPAMRPGAPGAAAARAVSNQPEKPGSAAAPPPFGKSRGRLVVTIRELEPARAP